MEGHRPVGTFSKQVGGTQNDQNIMVLQTYLANFMCQKVQHFQADSKYLGKINTKKNYFFFTEGHIFCNEIKILNSESHDLGLLSLGMCLFFNF